jgi:hypothetical protein
MRLKSLLLSSALLILPLPAIADTVYTYTGNSFTLIDGPSYSTSGKISGSLDLATPLESNLYVDPVTPVSFSFSDGSDLFSDVNSTAFFGFSTDASGKIIGWDIAIYDSALVIFTENVGQYVFDSAYNITTGSDAFNFNEPGLWVVSNTSPVPEPSSFALLATGVLGAAGILRRRLFV